jgi:hypothetical protein
MVQTKNLSESTSENLPSVSIKAKREELKSLSAAFKLLVKEGQLHTINQGLANFYAEQGHTEIKSYRQWRKDGFQVKKGSKALLLWGEPKPINSTEPKTEAQKEETFFPLAFVFSNLQVQKL